MNWTEEQITIVLYEYCRNPFGQFSSTKQFVKDLAKLLGRTTAAVVRKVGNLASLDPKMQARGVEGLSHISKLDKVVWDKYYLHWDELVYDAEKLTAKFKGCSLEDSLNINLNNLPIGEERIYEVKKRLNQKFFRDAVLSSYNNRCCITGINNSSLLEAGHIVGWAKDESSRTNPQSGLCLNSLLHKAYDNHLLGITPDYNIIIPDKFFGSRMSTIQKDTLEYFKGLDGNKLILPRRFLPDQNLLDIHYQEFKKVI